MYSEIVKILESHGVTGDVEIDPGCEHALYAALSMPDVEKVYFNETGLVIEYKKEENDVNRAV